MVLADPDRGHRGDVLVGVVGSMAEPLKAAVLVADTLARQSTETSEFASALDAIYRARYTGAAVLHFRYGEPKMIEFATTQIRLDNGRKHRPE